MMTQHKITEEEDKPNSKGKVIKFHLKYINLEAFVIHS